MGCTAEWTDLRLRGDRLDLHPASTSLNGEDHMKAIFQRRRYWGRPHRSNLSTKTSRLGFCQICLGLVPGPKCMKRVPDTYVSWPPLGANMNMSLEPYLISWQKRLSGCWNRVIWKIAAPIARVW